MKCRLCDYKTDEFDRLKNHSQGLHPELFQKVRQYVGGSDITASIEKPMVRFIKTKVGLDLNIAIPVDVWMKQ